MSQMLNGDDGRSVITPSEGGDAWTAEKRTELSGPGMRTFLSICDLWDIEETVRLKVLGFPPRSTYHSWAKQARLGEDIRLPFDTLMRISAVLGIHKALGILFHDPKDGVAWLRRPHTALPFSGRTPLDVLSSGTQDALMSVRRFLDGARGGIFMAPNEADRGFVPMTAGDIVFR